MSSGRVGQAFVLTCFFTAGYGRHRKLGLGFRTAGYGRHRSQWVKVMLKMVLKGVFVPSVIYSNFYPKILSKPVSRQFTVVVMYFLSYQLVIWKVGHVLLSLLFHKKINCECSTAQSHPLVIVCFSFECARLM